MSMPTRAVSKPPSNWPIVFTRMVSLLAASMLPEGHDPNSFFVQGGDARQFQSLLEAAQP